MKNLTAAAALSTLVACGYKGPEECFEKAENSGLELDVVRIACANGVSEVRNRRDGCDPVLREDEFIGLTFNFADVDLAPEDAALVVEYECGGFVDTNTGTDFYEFMSGGGVRMADVTFEAVGCFPEDTIFLDAHVVNFGSSVGECRGFGHVEVTVYPDGSSTIREEDGGGWNTYEFDAPESASGSTYGESNQSS